MPETVEGGYQTLKQEAQSSGNGSSEPQQKQWKVLSWESLMAVIAIAYGWMFWERISEFWFNPQWTTDDALQQIYPFHKVFHPQLFSGDLITRMVEGYLPPLHYGISWALTWLTGDPIMMGHWVMLLQIGSALLFLFLAVRRAAGTAPALFAVTWMLHTRHVMQRMTCGLPRGWSPLVFSAYLYFAISGNHWGMLTSLLIGCLLHPPATFVIAIAYGLYLLYRVAMPETRRTHIKPFVRLMIASPLFLVITLWVLHRPPEIGDMVSYQETLTMPEFQRPTGRFPFVPLRPAWDEIKSFAFQAFVTRFYYPGKFWKRNMHDIVLVSMVLVLFWGWRRGRSVIPLGVVTFTAASAIVYFASRLLAFKLYVPDRHLQIPFAYVWITGFTIGVWRLLLPRGMRLALPELRPFPRLSPSQTRFSMLGLVLVAALVLKAGGLGLNGAMNFNFSRTKKGHAWEWLQKNSPLESLVAGHPTHLDSVFLFAERQGYVTTETAHPFYRAYNEEMKRRLAISLKAHYARNLEEFVAILEPEKIDYFVFERQQFYPEKLAVANYFPPLDTLTKELTAKPVTEYAFRQLPQTVDAVRYPFMPFRDGWSVVVDVKKLKEYLATPRM